MLLRKIFCNEHLMMMAIAINALVIFVGSFWPDSPNFKMVDALFTVLFTIEAVVKIQANGWKAYWQEGWNRFDLIVVLIALPSLADSFLESSIDTNVMLSLRSFRLIKSFKMFRLIPNINSLANGVKLAVQTSSLVVFAFTVFLLVFSVISVSLFGKDAPEYFGNPGISLYSTFRLFTVEGWSDMPDAIASHSSVAWAVFARVYFVVLLFFGGIIGMSLVNSIFVDAMAEDNNDELKQKIAELEAKIDLLLENRKQ